MVEAVREKRKRRMAEGEKRMRQRGLRLQTKEQELPELAVQELDKRRGRSEGRKLKLNYTALPQYGTHHQNQKGHDDVVRNRKSK